MDKKTVSCKLFKLSGVVTNFPVTIPQKLGRVVADMASAAGRGLRAVGAWIRGCGCTDDDPECCQRAAATNPKYRDWCLCDCHDSNTTARAAEHAEN